MEKFKINHLRNQVREGHTRPQSWRRAQLNRVKKLLEENEAQIIKALAEDLQKPSTEALFEILASKQELQVASKHLANCMKPRKVKAPP